MRRLVERAAGIDAHHDPRAGAAPGCGTDGGRGPGRGGAPVRQTSSTIPPEPWCPAPELDGPRRRGELLVGPRRLDVAASSRARRCCSSSTTCSGPTRPRWSWSAASCTGRIPGLLLVLTMRDDVPPPVDRAPTVLELGRLSPQELTELARGSPRVERCGRASSTGPSSAATASRSSSRSSCAAARLAQGEGERVSPRHPVRAAGPPPRAVRGARASTCRSPSASPRSAARPAAR